MGVTLHGKTFEPRARTGRVVVALQRAQQAVDDADDREAGIQVEMDHLGRRLQALATAEGEFDATTWDELIEARGRLRAKLDDAAKVSLRAQIALVVTTFHPVEGVDVDWCIDNLVVPDDVVTLMKSTVPDGDGDGPLAESRPPS